MTKEHHAGELFAVVVSGGSWLVAQATAAVTDLPPIVQTILENSVFAGLVLYFVWTAGKREEKTAARVSILEDQSRQLLERALNSMDANTEAINNIAKTMAGMQSELRECRLGGK